MKHLLLWIFSVLVSPIWVWLFHPWWRRKPANLWVIGGHRGRLYADNAREVERAAREAGYQTLFVANEPLRSFLRAQGIPAVLRHSFKARRAISQAQVLIYSHGEDDLDFCASLLRGRSAPRVYLNHSLNFLKAGGVTDPAWLRGGRLLRSARRWLLTDCDVILAASEPEMRTLQLAYPMHPVRLGGGAHLDAWQRALEAPPRKRLYWFPTFRDGSAARAHLAQVIREVTSHAKLRDWLVENGYELFIGTHVNIQESSLVQVEAPFAIRSPQTLVEEAASSECLISDYSGVVYDFLLTERGQIHFTFDLEDYLCGRALFTRHEDMHFALQVFTTEALVDAIVSRRFHSAKLSEAARAERQRCLPRGGSSFAHGSVQAIEAFIEERPA